MFLPTISNRVKSAQVIFDYQFYVLNIDKNPDNRGSYQIDTDTICINEGYTFSNTEELLMVLGHESDHRYQHLTPSWTNFFTKGNLDDLEEFVSQEAMKLPGVLIGQLEWGSYFVSAFELEVLLRDRLQEYWMSGFERDQVIVSNWRNPIGDYEDEQTKFFCLVERWFWIQFGASLLEEMVKLWYK